MKQEELEQLIERLRSVEPDHYIILDNRRVDFEEADYYANIIENEMEAFLNDDEFEDEESVMEQVREIADYSDNDAWMFDDEENEERNAIW